MLSYFKNFVLLISLCAACVFVGTAQETTPTPEKTPENKPESLKKAEKKPVKVPQTPKLDPASYTAEQIAESTIVVYGGSLAGRDNLKQIRKTAIEFGKVSITNPDGTIDLATYEKRILRGDNLTKEKIRFDQEFPTAKYALIYNDAKIVGLFNDSVFTPREDATKSFQNQIWHGIEALLRYKENEATVSLGTREKYMGVDYYSLEVTDKQNRKTRYFISTKLFRVAWLEYTEDDVKYVRKFSDYRYAQGTLVPYRSVLTANGKPVEEVTIQTVTYGQKIEDDTFQTG